MPGRDDGHPGALTETSGEHWHGTINVSGPTNWSGGTMSGSGITNAKGGLTLGGTATTSYYAMYPIKELGQPWSAHSEQLLGGRLLHQPLPSSGALFDNTSTGSLIFTSDYTNFQSNGEPSGGTFQNDGSLTKANPGSAAIGSGITFNDIGSKASLLGSSGTLPLQGGGTISSSGHRPGQRLRRLARFQRGDLHGLLGDHRQRRGRELLRRHRQHQWLLLGSRVDACHRRHVQLCRARRRPPWAILTEDPVAR